MAQAFVGRVERGVPVALCKHLLAIFFTLCLRGCLFMASKIPTTTTTVRAGNTTTTTTDALSATTCKHLLAIFFTIMYPTYVAEKLQPRTAGYGLCFPAPLFLSTVLRALRQLMFRGEIHHYQAYVLRLKHTVIYDEGE